MSSLTLIFIGLAAFIIWRLYSVLGTRTGNEQSHYEHLPDFHDRDENDDRKGKHHQNSNSSENNESEASNVFPLHPDLVDDEVRFPWHGYAEEGSELALKFDEIKEMDNQFHPRLFLEGAKMAYEMIVTAYADHDKKALKPLLSKKVYDGFVASIDAQKQDKQKTEMTFVGVQKAKITQATVERSDVTITVKFSSEIITTTYDEDDNLIDGDPNQVITIVDIWSFSRPVNAVDPNWYLVGTKSQ